MPLYQPDVVPCPAQSIAEVNARIAEWYTEGCLVSAAPQAIGHIENQAELSTLAETGYFGLVLGGSVLLDCEGVVGYKSDSGQHTQDIPTPVRLLEPMLRIIHTDVCQFTGLSGDATKISFDLYAGIYTASSETDAHIDRCFGLGYFGCLGASTEFLPGFFDKTDIKAAQQQRDRFPNVAFDSGVIVRADETMLHRAPILEKPSSRLLARFVINDVRKY